MKVSNERLAIKLGEQTLIRTNCAPGSFRQRLCDEDISILTELLSLRNAQSEAVAVTDEIIDERSPCVSKRPHDWKKLDSGNTVCMVCGNHRPWLVDRIRSALTHPAPPMAVTDEMVERLAAHQTWSLGFDDKVFGDDDDRPTHGNWVVWEETGNINDREWLVKGYGPTPLAALTAALEAKQ